MATSIGGTNYTDVGSSTAPLLLRSNGTIRCQWGGRFIDLIKNGKINADSGITFKTVSSESDMASDGIYVLDSEVYVVLNNNKLNLSSNDGSYITYLKEQELTAEQQLQFLKNLGIVVDNSTEISITSGFVYVLSEQAFYYVSNGDAKILTLPASSSTDEIDLSNINVETNCKISVNGSEKINISESNIEFNENITVPTTFIFKTDEGNTNHGIYLESTVNGSILYVDEVVQRNLLSNSETSEEENFETFYSVKSESDNIITSIKSNNSEYTINLTNTNEYEIGDKLFIVRSVTKSSITWYYNEYWRYYIQNDISRTEPILYDISSDSTYQVLMIGCQTSQDIFTGSSLEDAINNALTYFTNNQCEIINAALTTYEVVITNYQYNKPETLVYNDITKILYTKTLIINVTGTSDTAITTADDVSDISANSSIHLYQRANEETGVILYELNKETLSYKNFVENKIYSQFGTLDGSLPIDITKYPDAHSYTYSQILDHPKIFSPEFEDLVIYSEIEKPEDLTKSEYDLAVVPLSWIRDLIQASTANVVTQDDLKNYTKSSDVTSIINNNLPSGIIMLYNGTTAPSGWHLCDGTTENDTTYPSLTFDQEGINYIIKI